MWVKALDGKLVNLSNAFTVTPRPVKAVQTLFNSEVIGYAATVCETGPEGPDMSVGAIRLCWFEGKQQTTAGEIAKAYAQRVVDEIGKRIGMIDVMDLQVIQAMHRGQTTMGEPTVGTAPVDPVFLRDAKP